MYGLAVGAIAAVLMVLAAALTLLPALLGFVGLAIDRLHVPGLHVRAPTAGPRLLVPLEPDRAAPALAVRDRRRCWCCWCWPCRSFSMRLAFTDAGNDPTELDDPPGLRPAGPGVRPGFNGPLVIAADVPRPASAAAGRAAVEALDARLASVPGRGLRRARRRSTRPATPR